jgi:hypothetical protein
MNFYPGRKNMFLKIKNKFRFVSISLLLASLVTLVSSASAEEETGELFDFVLNVACAPEQTSASWAPVLEKYWVGTEEAVRTREATEVTVSVPSPYSGDPFSISALPGQTVEIQILLDWRDGTDCSGTPVPATGDYSGIFVGLPEDYTNDDIGNYIEEEVGLAGDTEFYDFFDIPDNALPDAISGSYELTWTP